MVTNNITRTLPVSNTYTITLADRQAVGAGSTDSCGTIDWAGSLITPGTFNCSNVGANNVTITVRDSNGNVLVAGDTVTVIKDLKVKGSSIPLKQGTVIRNIRLVEDDAEHIEGNSDKIKGLVLKTCFLRKA